MNKQLVRNVKSLIKDGDETSYLMLEVEPYFVQITRAISADKVCIRAVSNSHLKGDKRITPEQDQKMQALGLKMDGKINDYYTDIPNSPDVADKVSALIEQVFTVYGVNTARMDIDLVTD